MTIDKSQLRSQIFLHLDGIVTAPTAYYLHKKGVLDYIVKNKQVTLEELTQKFSANEGYLNVALHVLGSQGFLEYSLNSETSEVLIATNAKSVYSFSCFHLYEEVIKMLEETDFFTSTDIQSKYISQLNNLFEKYKRNWDINFSEDPLEIAIQKQVLKHIEGYLLGPIIVSLGMTGLFHKYFMSTSFQAEEFHKEPETFKIILNFFSHLDWFTQNNGNYQFTEKGLFFAKRATAYGVTVSYLPMFKKLNEMLFGKPTLLREIAIHEEEIHVNREMNVWGSGGAHTTYFKVIDDIIIELFNKPIEEQPKGILDMGCGNGAFLEHIFSVIEKQTLRGKVLDDHPLFLVGADYNQAALKVTRTNLIKADIWAKVVWGDIGRPDLLANDLQQNYTIQLGDLLNVRTFLDHNRIWETPKNTPTNIISKSTGAFAHKGKRLKNNLVEQNLIEHFQKWAPFVKKFGLLIIELHTIDPAITRANLGKTAATAYDATHGYSDQFILEIEVVQAIAKEVGLQFNPKFFKKFPDTAYATVSINLFKE